MGEANCTALRAASTRQGVAAPTAVCQAEAVGGIAMRKTVIGLCVVSLVGCAVPNKPGAGIGKTYTPVIDTSNVDGAKYSRDLDECRQLASQVDDGKAVLAGLIGGALVGAAVGSAYGVRGRHMDGLTTTGALAGSGAAGNRASNRQEAIMGNCMAGRGYRVLDGTASVTHIQGVPSAAQPAATQPAAIAEPGFQLSTPRTVTVSAPPPAAGQYGFEAAKMAREQRCANFDTPAQFISKGSGYETYSVACTSGDTMMVRCEFGTCRPLR